MSDVLANADLAPTSRAQRTWSLWHIASLWVGMSICIPSCIWMGVAYRS